MPGPSGIPLLVEHPPLQVPSGLWAFYGGTLALGFLNTLSLPVTRTVSDRRE